MWALKGSRIRKQILARSKTPEGRDHSGDSEFRIMSRISQCTDFQSHKYCICNISSSTTRTGKYLSECTASYPRRQSHFFVSYIHRHWVTYSEDYCTLRSRDSAVGIATGYWLDGRGIGLRVQVRVRFFYSPRRPDRFWNPLSLL
jgi:hypothetical protein